MLIVTIKIATICPETGNGFLIIEALKKDGTTLYWGGSRKFFAKLDKKIVVMAKGEINRQFIDQYLPG
uniref:Uncharacterized protein n=1 Tax=Romanomermis culicivorax TaxID=13658 RepID=A0A915KQJ4_ROMCU